MELEVLRHRAVCRGCGSKLPPRSSAWIHVEDDGTELVVCESCYRMGTYPGSSSPRSGDGAGAPGGAVPAGPPIEELSESAVEAVAQSVAQSVAESLARSVEESAVAAAAAAAEEAAARAAALAAAAQPVVDVAPLEAGALVLRPDEAVGDVGPDPVPEAPAAAEEPAVPSLAWSAADELFQGPPIPGATGSRGAGTAPAPVPEQAVEAVPESVRAGRVPPTDEVGRVLQAAENRGLVWLGPRTTPDGRSIDQVALSPNGLWLVRVLAPPTGRVEHRDVGDWFTSEPRLFVGQVDHTALVAECVADEASVARSLVASPLESIPRYQVLCFDDLAPAWLERPFEFQGLWVTWSHHLVEPMLATVHLQRADVARLAGLLDRILTRG